MIGTTKEELRNRVRVVVEAFSEYLEFLNEIQRETRANRPLAGWTYSVNESLQLNSRRNQSYLQAHLVTNHALNSTPSAHLLVSTGNSIFTTCTTTSACLNTLLRWNGITYLQHIHFVSNFRLRSPDNEFMFEIADDLNAEIGLNFADPTTNNKVISYIVRYQTHEQAIRAACDELVAYVQSRGGGRGRRRIRTR